MYFYYLPEACRGAGRGDISDKVACNFRRTLTSPSPAPATAAPAPPRKKSHRITPQLSAVREYLYAPVPEGGGRGYDGGAVWFVRRVRGVFICQVSSRVVRLDY